MSSADVHGKFLWHELMTTDPSAAGVFYSRVLGWKAQAWDRDPSYTVLSGAHGPLGGMMKLPAEAQANGASSSWLAYVAVPDVDSAAAAAQRLGGRIVKPASSLPDGGKYAVLADPQSAAFGVCTAPSSTGGHGADEFVWHELRTSDSSGAFRFYRELFGWEQLGVHDMGAMGPYLLFGRGGRQLGGMFTRSSGAGAGTPPHWLVYVRVASAAKVAEAATAAGGRVLQAAHQVPGGSWAAQLADPQGATVAVNQPAAAAAASTGTAPAAGAASATRAAPAAPQAPRPAAPPKPAAAVPPRPAKPAQPPASPAPVARPPASSSSPPPRPVAPRPVEAPRPQSTSVAAPAASRPTPAAPPPSAAPSTAARPTPPRVAAAPKAAAPNAAAPQAAAPKTATPKAAKPAARKKARKAAPRRAAAKRRKKAASRKKSSARRGGTRRGAARRGAARRGAARRGAARRRPASRRTATRSRRKTAKRPARKAARKRKATGRRRR